MDGRSADTSLTERVIGEQSECIKGEFEKMGSHKLPQAHEKVCNENETKKKMTRA